MTPSIIELFASLLSCMLIIYILNGLVNTRIKNKISENVHPITISILKAILFFSAGVLLSEITEPFQTIVNVLPSTINGNELMLKEVMFYALFLGIILITLILTLWFSIIMFGVFSQGKNIFIETANNNLNDVILFCGILIALVFAVKAGITPLLDQFIPYPKMPIYH